MSTLEIETISIIFIRRMQPYALILGLLPSVLLIYFKICPTINFEDNRLQTLVITFVKPSTNLLSPYFSTMYGIITYIYGLFKSPFLYSK